ncbi:MAG: CPBP family intramembrane metalloprotease [Weeksellaceae bacterium]|nr:CPBP family intramembrane metalloprotease [Weeksellaceae bacterium]
MEKSQKGALPHFVFDWRGVLALLLGVLIPAIAAQFFVDESGRFSDAFLVISNAALWLGAIFSFDYFVCRPQTGRKLNFSFAPQNFTTYLFIFPLMLGMMLIAEFLTSQLPVRGPFFGPMYETFSKLMEQMTKNTGTLVVLAVMMAPLFEEIVFRGIIQKGLINKGVKPIWAIWIAALAFGIVHGNPWQFVGAVLLGYVLGLVYYRTKSLLMPILLHAFNNLVSVLLIHYTKTESFAEAFRISEYLLLGIGIVMFGLFFYLFTQKYGIHHSEN